MSRYHAPGMGNHRHVGVLYVSLFIGLVAFVIGVGMAIYGFVS